MWPARPKVDALFQSSFMQVEDGYGYDSAGNFVRRITFTNLSSRRRLKLLLREIFGDDPCKILHSQYMKRARVPPVNSGSDSIIIIADIDIPNRIAYRDVIFKITFESKTARNQYQIEALVYEFLARYELPFVMQHYKTYYCLDFSQVLRVRRDQSEESGRLIEQIRRRGQTLHTHQSDNYNFNNAQIILTERGGGMSLEDAISAIQGGKLKNLNEEDWIAIFMQTVFCLAFFEDIGIMHHDLHLGNIWLDKTDQKVRYVLGINKESKPIVVVTDYIVKIYDFDNAAVLETPYSVWKGSRENTLLRERCPLLGECNLMNVGRDYAQVCWWLRRASHLLPRLVNDIITTSVDPQFLANSAADDGGTLSWMGQPCVSRGAHNACQPYETRSVVQMLRRFASYITDEQERESNARGAGIIEEILHLPSYGA